MGTDGVDGGGNDGGAGENDASEPSMSEEASNSLDGTGGDDAPEGPTGDGLSDGDQGHGYDEAGIDTPAAASAEPTQEERNASQERMEAEAQAAKQAYEAQQDAALTEQTYAEALEQEIAAQNAVATGEPVQATELEVETYQAPPGFEISPEAVVMNAAYEIAPSGNIFGRDYGVVTAGRDGYATELEAVEFFQEVVEWYRSGEGATEYELGTTIYQAADGTFGHNDIVTFYSETSVSPFLDVPDDAQVVAVAHSHPEPRGLLNNLFGYDGEDFSGRDISGQERMERMFGEGFSLYMVSPTNQLNVYPPEQ